MKNLNLVYAALIMFGAFVGFKNAFAPKVIANEVPNLILPVDLQRDIGKQMSRVDTVYVDSCINKSHATAPPPKRVTRWRTKTKLVEVPVVYIATEVGREEYPNDTATYRVVRADSTMYELVMKR